MQSSMIWLNAVYSAIAIVFSATRALTVDIVHQLAKTIYNIFLHPLSKFPGPRLWAGSRFIWTYHELRGDLPFQIERFHLQYGPVVRIAPDELSFTNPAVMKDIYGGTTSRQLDRDPYIFPPPDFGPKGNPILVDHVQHARTRRAMNRGFTPSAIEKHAKVAQRHVSELFDFASQHCDATVDVTRLFGLLSFDIIGHLTFSEDFRSLAEERPHPLYAFILQGFLGGVLMSAFNRHGLYGVFKKLVPRSVLLKQHEPFDSLATMVRKRVACVKDHPPADFVSYMAQPDKTGQELDLEEIEASSLVLLIGGSETVATTLTGTVLYLLRDPQRSKRVTDEVRTYFISQEEIDAGNTTPTHLPYLNACIEEGLRIASPSPFSLARRTAMPMMIAGHAVPANTSVGLAQWASFHSPDNFDKPHHFIPERFLDTRTGDFFANSDFHPWGYGPRNCPGRNLAYIEMRLILASLLLKFDMKLDDRHQDFKWTDQKVNLVWSKEPFYVKFSKYKPG